jgi:tripartite-type tricarboxylate transporter receptor subunit TctC
LVEKINADVLRILSNQEVQDRLRSLELAPLGMSVTDTAVFIKDEAVLWARVIRDANVQGE